MSTHMRMLLQGQSDLDVYCFSKRLLNISAGDKNSRLLMDNGALRVKYEQYAFCQKYKN